MGNGKVINDVLVHLFNEVWQLEKSALTAGEFKDLTYNDMHIIEAVGLDGQKMSDIAAALHITVGSLTTSMNGLVKKWLHGTGAEWQGPAGGLHPSDGEGQKSLRTSCRISPPDDGRDHAAAGGRRTHCAGEGSHRSGGFF